MKVLVDQSGKIENTSKDTVIAFSNGESYALRVSARVKRDLQKIYRRQGKNKIFVYKVFGGLIFLLIKRHLKRINTIVIDTEYPGKEKIIKEVILENLKYYRLHEPQIEFKRIGNRPKVHYAAYNVYVGKIKADKNIESKDLLQLANKKNRGQKD